MIIKNMVLASQSQLNSQTTYAGFIAAFSAGLVYYKLIPDSLETLASIVSLSAFCYQAYLTNRPSREQIATQKLLANAVQTKSEVVDNYTEDKST